MQRATIFLAVSLVLSAAILSCLSIRSASAGFDQGRQAYDMKNYAAALREFIPLAKKGDAKAQRYLGNMYRYGHGMKADLVTGTNWLHKSAKQGYVMAQYDLGLMFKNMAITKSQYATAIKWLTAAAKQGHVEARFHLGMMYLDGDGVESDNLKALVLLAGAAKKIKKARPVRDQLMERMTKEEISKAKALGMSLFKSPPKVKTFQESKRSKKVVRGKCGEAGNRLGYAASTLEIKTAVLQNCVGENWGGTLCTQEIENVDKAFQDLRATVQYMRKNC